MGACFDFFVSNTDDQRKALKQFHRRCEECRYEYGHGGYTGTFAECWDVRFLHRTFDSNGAAAEAIEETHEKWDPVMAVLVRGKRKNSKSHWVFGAWCSS